MTAAPTDHRGPVALVCLGEALIDLVAEEAGVLLKDAARFVRAAGGAPANVAAGAARLGVSSGFVGKVGADAFGSHLEETLAQAGVDTSRLRRDPLHRTGLAFVSLGPSGERDFLFFRHPSADQYLAPEELDEAYLAGARILHIGTLSLVGGPAREATLRALRVAGGAGALRSLDVNLRLDAWPSAARAREVALAAGADVEVVKVSADELEFLAGGVGPAAAAGVMGPATRLVVVTRGAGGADYHLADGRRGSVSGFAVEAIDTTGAGDAFVAGLLAGLSTDPSALADPEALRAVLRRANACGALATLRLGAIPALPSLDELEAFLSVQAE